MFYRRDSLGLKGRDAVNKRTCSKAQNTPLAHCLPRFCHSLNTESKRTSIQNPAKSPKPLRHIIASLLYSACSKGIAIAVCPKKTYTDTESSAGLHVFVSSMQSARLHS